MRVLVVNGNFQGVRGMLPQEILEDLDCLGLHLTRFHGGQREKWNIE